MPYTQDRTQKPFKLFKAFSPIGSAKINQPYIVDLVTLDSLGFQNVPRDLVYEPNSSFVALESPGRNNPLYHYTGSEDTLQFTLSWYSDHASRADVITNCKWLEALSKNDGYDNKPHPVRLVWGELFTQSKWLVTSAKYTLTLFDRPIGMLPKLASQELILKRITDDNLTYKQITQANY